MKQKSSMKKASVWKKLKVQILYFLIFSVPACADASPLGGSSLTSFFDNVYGFLSSTLGLKIAIIAIAGIGYSCIWKGWLAKEKAIPAMFGIAVLFGAPWIVQQIYGG